MNILGIVPARKGSKRVPGKNFKLLAGKPLVTHTFNTALQSKKITRLITSTDDEKIMELAAKHQIEVPFIRPLEFANDRATDFDWIKHAVNHLRKQNWHADYVVILRPTQPLRDVADIDKAIDLIIKKDFDSVRSLTKVKNHPFWMKKLTEEGTAIPFLQLGKSEENLRSQDLPLLYSLNGIVDVINVRNLDSQSLYGSTMGYILINEQMAIDLDTLQDFELAEIMLEKLKKEEIAPELKKEKIILIGAREDGHAGVILDIINEYNLFDVVGFIDDSEKLQERSVKGIPVLGTRADILTNKINLNSKGVTGFFVCTGSNSFRKSTQEQFNKILQPVNVIHPTATISKSATLNKGIFVGPKAIVGHNVKIEDGVLINTSATIDHDNIIAEFANICPGCHTSGGVKIGSSAFLGTGTSVIPDITIGENTVVGAGSVIIKDVPANQKVVGVPAKEIR